MTSAVSYFEIEFFMGRAGEMIFAPGRLKVVLWGAINVKPYRIVLLLPS